MNKKTVNISSFVVLLFAVFFLPFQGFSNTPNKKNAALTDNEIRWRVDNLGGPIDYRYTEKVRSEVEGYVSDYRKGAEQLLGRVTIYFPVFDQKIKEKNLPEELKYLSLIESSLRVDAYSRVGAAGLWQFMRGTAREYGLTVNKSYDQRYDVEESTEAALEYLSVLYGQFDDWTLALAAYNCGPGNVRKAMRKSGGRDYWSIRKYLPKETRNYIPKFVAATYLMKYFYEHELMPQKPEDYFYETAVSKVYKHLSFDEIVQVTSTPLGIIKKLNPSFRKGYIPVNTNGMRLVLPRQSMYSLMEIYNAKDIRLIPEKSINFNHYIRTKFRPEVARYMLINNNEKVNIALLPIKDISYFTKGNRIFETKTKSASKNEVLGIRRYTRNRNYLTYRLKSGETLFDVIKLFPEANFEKMMRINNISLNDSPPPGTLLKIEEK